MAKDKNKKNYLITKNIAKGLKVQNFTPDRKYIKQKIMDTQ